MPYKVPHEMYPEIGPNEIHPEIVPHEIRLEIDGLTSNHDGTFTLTGIKPLDIDYPALTNVLINAGIEGRDAEDLVEDFGQMIFMRTIAKVIAQRTKRI